MSDKEKSRSIPRPSDFGGFYTGGMFARKVRVEFDDNGERKPAPLKWLDSFAMRSFTNDQVFDDTLPVTDGIIEIGSRVPLELLRERMEDWFRRKSYLPKDSPLHLRED